MNDELADLMVRDPFDTPFVIPPDAIEHEAMLRMTQHLFPGRAFSDDSTMIFAVPCTWRKTVIGAQAGTCDACSGSVWLAPSSLRTGERVVVCLLCAERAVKVPP